VNDSAASRAEGAALATAGPLSLLRRRDAVAIIVGIVVGAGIFRTPSMVADVTGDAGWVLALWVAGGVISLIGALCYAELASTYPHAGGDYHFVTRAYGRDVSFLYAWARATVINTGSIALLAFVFGDYMSRLAPLGAHSSALWAALLVVALTLVNLASLRASARTQNMLTIIEVTGLVAVCVAGLVAAPATAAAPMFATTPPLGLLGLAMVFVLLTYGGWNEAAYISAELRGGHRAIVSTLVVSILILTTLYVAVNAALIHGLGMTALAQGKAAPADLLGRAFGPWAAQALSIVVAIAALTSMNATMLVGARTNYALGRDWPALRFLGGWNSDRGVPTAAFLTQGAIALALIAFGALQKDGFEAMVEFTAPVFWGFLCLVGIAVFVLRRREPDARRPFRVPLYPLTPAAFVLVCAYLFYSSIAYATSRSAIHVSLLVMAAGAIAWFVTRMAARTRDAR
jgi:APA family basic amino acid/polyamine antiporter